MVTLCYGALEIVGLLLLLLLTVCFSNSIGLHIIDRPTAFGCHVLQLCTGCEPTCRPVCVCTVYGFMMYKISIYKIVHVCGMEAIIQSDGGRCSRPTQARQ